MKHVFIIGSKGIPAEYGGFETFVQELVLRKKADDLIYHVACCDLYRNRPAKPVRDMEWNSIHCFHIPVIDIGSARAVIYDLKALKYCLSYIRKNRISGAIVYILASRIGPFLGRYKEKLKAAGTVLLVNPDGHEWKREKWNFLIKCYWRISERGMIRNAEQVICDSKAIQSYINHKYSSFHPKTSFIPYGAYCVEDPMEREDLLKSAGEDARKWLREKGAEPGQYYLVVGRFVPENNYECILREFMQSKTSRRLLIITDFEGKDFYSELKRKTGFEKDDRICFAGTLYERKILTIVRMMAFAYIHGHSVGGTNPSLLESMGTTNVNLLFDVQYNREVGQEAAAYWTKEAGCLSKAIQRAEELTERQREKLGSVAKARVCKYYSWEQVVSMYESLFFKDF